MYNTDRALLIPRNIIIIIIIMFHAIWEFARSADRVTQSEDRQTGSQSADGEISSINLRSAIRYTR